MRKTIVLGAATALSLALAGTAQADTVQTVNGGPWATSNSTVFKTPEGVHFGTYADAGVSRGHLLYTGTTGTLSQVSDFSFTFNYWQAGNLTGAAPYARIWPTP